MHLKNSKQGGSLCVGYAPGFVAKSSIRLFAMSLLFFHWAPLLIFMFLLSHVMDIESIDMLLDMYGFNQVLEILKYFFDIDLDTINEIQDDFIAGWEQANVYSLSSNNIEREYITLYILCLHFVWFQVTLLDFFER